MISKVSYTLMAALVAVTTLCMPVQAKPKKNPKVSALLSKSYVFYKVRNYNGALKCLDKALELEPRAPGLFFLRAEVRKKTGQLQDAASDYQTASMYLSLEGKEKQAKHCRESAAQIESAIYSGKAPSATPIPKVVQELQYKLDHPDTPSAQGTSGVPRKQSTSVASTEKSGIK